MTGHTMTRRTALKALGTGVGAVGLLPWLSDDGMAAFAEVQKAAAASKKATPPALKALTAEQYATVEALVDAIIPTDERSPGAKEARVADYIDLLLSEQDDARQDWLTGLAALDAEATKQFQAPVAKLNAIQLEKLLTDISRNERAPEEQHTPLEKFFVTTKRATIFGYYTSEIGIHKDLHYQGNQFTPEFLGCLTVDGKDCPHCGQKAETL
jgi:Gluconate 2-dehydrogenase subunit 3